MNSNHTLSNNVPNVKISLQSLSEHKIQEISFDGRESFIKPFTMSESLTDLANKIDFLAEDDHEDTTGNKEQEASETETVKKQWPWEGIRTQLSRALIEINVLCDVMTVAQNKPTSSMAPNEQNMAGHNNNAEQSRYLKFDVAAKEQEGISDEQKAMNQRNSSALQLTTKKKCLEAAAKILKGGAERLSKAQGEISGVNGYHSQLLSLRKQWRIRRVGDKIRGDLSFSSCGSDFYHPGAFEVIKNNLDADADVSSDEEELVGRGLNAPPTRCPISVKVSSDLRGYASILVSVVDRNRAQEVLSTRLRYSDVFPRNRASPTEDPIWHQKLCRAQNVLFCKELFSRLCNEANQYKCTSTVSPFLVVENTISTDIFPETQLVVKLLYSKTLPVRTVEINHGEFSIKHVLLHLLQNFHSRRLNIPVPHPTCAVMGLTTQMRDAAIKAKPLKQLQADSERRNTSLMESLVSMAKPLEISRRVDTVLKSVAEAFPDFDIQSHWSIINSVIESSVRILITSHGYDFNRSALQLTLSKDGIKSCQLLHSESKVLTLPINCREIYDYLGTFLMNHQLMTIQHLAKTLRWVVLQFTPHAAVFPHKPVNGVILVGSSCSNCNVFISCCSDFNGKIDYEVKVQHSKAHDLRTLPPSAKRFKEAQNDIVQNNKYLVLGGEWKTVDLSAVTGRSFLQKLEVILTTLYSR